MSLVIESKSGGDHKPHPDGIHSAICVDVIDMGPMETEWQGQARMVEKVRVLFETEERDENGAICVIGKTFTKSLHPKARLTDFLGKWRGRPVMLGESIDLDKLIGACCTLVISHQQSSLGRTYASIDAVAKPTKKLVASGVHDPVLARERIEEWKLKDQTPSHKPQQQPAPAPRQARPLAPLPDPDAPRDPPEPDDLPF